VRTVTPTILEEAVNRTVNLGTMTKATLSVTLFLDAKYALEVGPVLVIVY